MASPSRLPAQPNVTSGPVSRAYPEMAISVV